MTADTLITGNSSPRSAGGSTLVSLMVGLAMGIICILSLLAIFQTMVRTNAASSTAARSEGAIATGMLAAQIAIQEAGFGVEAASAPAGAADIDFVVVASAALNGQTMAGIQMPIGSAGNAVIWHTHSGVVDTCSALLSTGDASGGGLSLLGPANCTDARDWGGANIWAASAVLIPEKPEKLITAYPSGFSQASFFQTYRGAYCAPFGRMAPASAVAVSFGAGSVQDRSTLAEICLPNIPN